MNVAKRTLLGLTRDELADFAESIGEPRYRGHQIFLWLYGRRATSFDRMTDLGKSLRDRLDIAATVGGISPVTQHTSARDGTIKFLFELHDGLQIESVLIPPASAFRSGSLAREAEQQRLTLCVSTQVGCPLDCKFCATGTMVFRRNLTAGEIVGQLLQAQGSTGKKITNVVFMGMGEPLLNYDNVMKAVEIFSMGSGIAARRITLSTAGWVEGIRRMGIERRNSKLALSLHSAVEDTRKALMPVAGKYGLAELKNALEEYYHSTRQRVTYEFIFFDGVNDTPEEVRALVKFARSIPSKINVIPFHSIAFAGVGGYAAELRPSRRVDEIVDELRSSNLTVMVRGSAGEDIHGACGQLVVMDARRRRTAEVGGR
jgi:23S rRNA (adenine2503-C2)-methyltransferase